MLFFTVVDAHIIYMAKVLNNEARICKSNPCNRRQFLYSTGGVSIRASALAVSTADPATCWECFPATLHRVSEQVLQVNQRTFFFGCENKLRLPADFSLHAN